MKLRLARVLAVAALIGVLPASAMASVNRNQRIADKYGYVYENRQGVLIGVDTSAGKSYSIGSSHLFAARNMAGHDIGVIKWAHHWNGVRVQVGSINLQNRTFAHPYTYALSTRFPFEFVTDLEMRANGSIAWISGGAYTPTSPVLIREVHVLDSTGDRIVDTGTGIDPTSLAASGGHVYWTSNGNAMGAPIN